MWHRCPASDERDRLVEGRPARTDVGHRDVLEPDRHAAEQDELVRRREDLRDGPAVHRPGHLRAAVQPFGTQQQHDGLQVHPHVGPLGPAQVAVDVAEQGGGCAEALPVLPRGPLARLPVLTRDPERAVALPAEGGSALLVRRLQRGRVHLVLPLIPGVARGQALAGALLELGQRLAGQHVDVPGLEVRSGRRPGRGGQHALQQLPRDLPAGESAHRPAARDRLVHLHDQRPLRSTHPSSSHQRSYQSIQYHSILSGGTRTLGGEKATRAARAPYAPSRGTAKQVRGRLAMSWPAPGWFPASRRADSRQWSPRVSGGTRRAPGTRWRSGESAQGDR